MLCSVIDRLSFMLELLSLLLHNRLYNFTFDTGSPLGCIRNSNKDLYASLGKKTFNLTDLDTSTLNISTDTRYKKGGITHRSKNLSSRRIHSILKEFSDISQVTSFAGFTVKAEDTHDLNNDGRLFLTPSYNFNYIYHLESETLTVQRRRRPVNPSDFENDSVFKLPDPTFVKAELNLKTSIYKKIINYDSLSDAIQRNARFQGVTIICTKSNESLELNYPINLVNLSETTRTWQVDTGPIFIPSKIIDQSSDNTYLRAYIAFNSRGAANLLVSRRAFCLPIVNRCLRGYYHVHSYNGYNYILERV